MGGGMLYSAGPVMIFGEDFRSGFSVRIFGQDFREKKFPKVFEHISPTKPSQWFKLRENFYQYHTIVLSVLPCPWSLYITSIVTNPKTKQTQKILRKKRKKMKKTEKNRNQWK